MTKILFFFKFLSFIAIFAFVLFTGCGKKYISNETNKDNTSAVKKNSDNSENASINDNNHNLNIPAGLTKLLKAYPDFLDHADSNHIFWKDGTSMIWDDGNKKSHDEMLDNPDLEDMMSQSYKKGNDWDNPPKNNFEPGRIRYEPFFKKMYGSSESAVKDKTVSINWFGTSILVTKINNINTKLDDISKELAKLPQEHQKYLARTGGAFNWRNIAGTDRLSTHSFATAIDINTDYSDYWQWSKDLSYKKGV
jgi:hypothetical protein